MALESMRRQGVEGVGMGMWLVVRVPGMVSRLRPGACPAAGMPRVLSRSLEPWISPRRPGWCFVRRERPKSKAQTRVAGAGSLSDGSSETQDDWTIQTNVT